MTTIPIRYCFRTADGTRETFCLELDGRSLVSNFTARPEDLPAWTALAFHQCPHCPQDPETHRHCPAAVRLVPLILSFDRLLSHDTVHLEVTTTERTISQQTTAQRGISSLMGLVIATSGCPHTIFLKPMARFHLPLASEEETIYRAASMYLLAQYFIAREGGPADLELAGLTTIYQDLQRVNNSISNRLRAATETDSSINALVLLDLYAKAMPYVIKDSLEELRHLFLPYLG